MANKPPTSSRRTQIATQKIHVQGSTEEPPPRRRRFLVLTSMIGAAKEFYRGGGPMLAGAISFYALLATAPMLMLALVLAGFALGEETAKQALLRYLQEALGTEGARSVWSFVKRTQDIKAQGTAAFLGSAFLAYAASRLFLHLQQALNLVYGVRRKGSGAVRRNALRMVRERTGMVAMVFCCGALLSLLLLLKVAFTAIVASLPIFPLLRGLVHLAEFGCTALLFAMLFTILLYVLPDAELSLRDAWAGALLAAIAIDLSSFFLGIYLGHFVKDSPYGAIGSVALFLLWLHYNAQVLVFGASFTRVWAHAHERVIRPGPHAISIVEMEHVEHPTREDLIL